MNKQFEELASGIERSVADNVLDYVSRSSADWADPYNVLDDIWDAAAEELCDQFPDIESIRPIDQIEGIWKAEMTRRKYAIELIASVNGVEKLVIKVSKALGWYAMPHNRSEREVIEAVFGTDLVGGYFAQQLNKMRSNWHVWYLGLDSYSQRMLARDFISYWRRKSGEKETL